MNKSQKSSKSNRKQEEGFRATPPTDDQIKKLNQLCSTLDNFINQGNSDSDDSFISTAKSYIKNLKKVFQDLWCEYREGQKTNNGDLLTSSSTKISQQSDNTLSDITKLYRSTSDFLNHIFSQNLKKSASATLFPYIIELLQKIVKIYFESTDEIIQNAKNSQNIALIPGFKTHQLKALEEISNSVLELQSKYYELGKQTKIDYKEFQEGSEEEDEENDKASKSSSAKETRREKQKTEERFNTQLESLDELQKFFNALHELITTRVNDLSKSREAPEEGEAPNTIHQIVNIAKNYSENLQNLYPSEQETQNPAEGFNSAEYLEFAQHLYVLLNGLWHGSYKLGITEEFETYSKMLIDFVQDDIEKFKVHFFSLDQLSNIYLEAFKLQDTEACDDLYELILVQLQGREEEIEIAVRDEADFIVAGVSTDDDDNQAMSSASSRPRRQSSKRALDPSVERFMRVAKKKNAYVYKISREFFDVYYKCQQKIGTKLDDDLEFGEEESINEYSDIYNHVMEIIYSHCTFVERQVQEMKKMKPQKTGDVVGRTAKSVRNDNFSSPSKSRISVQSDASNIFQTQIYTAQTRALYESLLSGYDLIIQANRNRLYLMIMKLSMQNKDDITEIKEFANQLKSYTFDYIKYLNQAKDEANNANDYEYMEELETRNAKLVESPQALSDSFTKSFEEACDFIVNKYMIYTARVDAKLNDRMNDVDLKSLTLMEEKKKLHIEQLTLLEKNYFIKEETEKQRPVIETEKMLENAKKHAAAKNFQRAKEIRDEAFKLEEETINKRLEQIQVDLKRERSDLLAKQENKLRQIEKANEKEKEQVQKKYDEKKQVLLNGLMPALKTRANQIIETATSCMSLIAGTAESQTKRQKQQKGDDLRGHLLKVFNKVIEKTLKKYEINIVV